MQNETSTNFPEQSEAALLSSETPTLNAGVDLKAAREASRMSASDAAYALKVSPRVIDALEAGRWSDLPGRAFAVGILRAYGRLLEVPVDALVAVIPGSSSAVKRADAPASSAPRAIAPKARRDGEMKRQTNRMLKSGVIMVLVAVLLAYAVPGDFWENALQETQAQIQRLTGSKQQESMPATGQEGVPSSTEQGATTPAVTTEQQAQTGTGTLELRFSAPAWVEVRDNTGRIIYSQLNAAGTTQFITGAAPLDVMIGNAKQVQARWRDEPIKLDKLSGDDVARQILR